MKVAGWLRSRKNRRRRSPSAFTRPISWSNPTDEQLVELAGLANDGSVRPTIDSVFPLKDARAAFDRVMAPGKRGKVVIEVDHAMISNAKVKPSGRSMPGSRS